MHKLPMTCLLIATFALQAASLEAPAVPNSAAGKDKAALCFACHGSNGKSVMSEYPNLAGQNQAYLVLALTAYRDGQRPHQVMAPMAQGLSDEDIQNIAAYFSTQQ